MTFFQADVDPIHLREKHQDNVPLKPNSTLPTQPSSTLVGKLFQNFFKGSTNNTNSRITSDPMNRLVSFHL